jgi:hypothetical protein
MRMMIQYSSGLRVEAILLAASTERMRIVVMGQRDACELTLRDGCWYTEKKEAITIEALTSVADVDSAQFCAGVYPRTAGAGRSWSL